ncbi:MAG: TetR/AcrR family transcriptional regulator [Acidimicrobiales bacterium]|nr:TetR/AcrR family transcriptional regulator [Acidimicrobiales bacterium]
MTSMDRGGPGGSSPDPSVRDRVLDAFVDLVAERGLATTSIDDVAAEAGVSKTTLYTRWPDRRSLIVDGFRYVAARVPTLDPAVPFNELLDRILRSTADERVQRRRRQIMAELLAGAGVDDELAEITRAQRRGWYTAVEDLIERGKRSGDVPADRDTAVAAELFVAVILNRQLTQLEVGPPLHDLVRRLLTEERPY